jgi:hypothetical protein
MKAFEDLCNQICNHTPEVLAIPAATFSLSHATLSGTVFSATRHPPVMKSWIVAPLSCDTPGPILLKTEAIVEMLESRAPGEVAAHPGISPEAISPPDN